MRCWIILLLSSFVWGSRMPLPRIAWTAAESTWMAQHPVVRLGVDPDRCPVEFVDAQGRHQGVSLNIVRYLERTTGLRFETTTHLKWNAVLQEIENKRLDMVASIRPTAKRRGYMAFTRPYMRIPIVIVARAGGDYVEGVSGLRGKKLGVLPGNSTFEFLKNDSLDADYVEYPSYHAALVGLAKGENDAVIANLAIVNYELQTHDLPVRIAAPTRYESEFAVGVRDDWPELVGILDRALAGLTEEEKNAYKNEWVNANIVLGMPLSQVLGIGSAAAVAFLLVISLVVRWNRRLKQEVEERKRAQTQALEIANKFSLLFNNMDQAFSVQRLLRNERGEVVDYVYLEVNPAFGRLFGTAPARFIGKRRREIAMELDEGWLGLVAKVVDTGEPLEQDQQLPDSGRWLHYCLFSPGKELFACTITDITEQKNRLVHMASHLEEMSHFIYSVSHDLSGPNLTIGSFARMLQEDLADCGTAEVRENLGYIITASQRMTALLEGLLSVARVGPRTMERRPLYLHDLATEAGRIVGGLFQEKRIALEITPETVALFADHDRLLQVFQNLFENAAKYMGNAPSPWVRVGVRTQNLEKVICVSDNGAGIPQNKLQVIFDLFVKVDKASQGTGIGLALVKRIVEAHGGRIWAESAGPGQGSTFCFTLGG